MFSYAEYRNIITLVKHNLPIMDFSEVSDDVDSFCVLRHDIEFSIDRALEMARIEHEDLNVHSTYTVQLRNNTYNALSQKNIEAISISSYDLKHKEVSSRFVNLKFLENDEFIFFSNYDSPKSLAFNSDESQPDSDNYTLSPLTDFSQQSPPLAPTPLALTEPQPLALTQTQPQVQPQPQQLKATISTLWKKKFMNNLKLY